MIASSSEVGQVKAQTKASGSLLPPFVASSKDGGAKTTSFADAMRRSAKALGGNTSSASAAAASSVNQQNDAADASETVPALQPQGPAADTSDVDQEKLPVVAQKVVPQVVVHTSVLQRGLKAMSPGEPGKKLATPAIASHKTSSTKQDDADSTESAPANAVVVPVAGVVFLQVSGATNPPLSALKPEKTASSVRAITKTGTQAVSTGAKTTEAGVSLQASSDAATTEPRAAVEPDTPVKLLPENVVPAGGVTVPALIGGICAAPQMTLAGPGSVGSDVSPAQASVSHSSTTNLHEPAVTSIDSAKPNQIEVGVRGGEFGWVKVRAELSQSGEVNTFLRGSSAETTHALSVQASSIHSFLGSQDVTVKSVQVETPQAAASFSASTSSESAGGGDVPQQKFSSPSSPNSSLEDASTDNDVTLQSLLPASTVISLASTGNRLSVRA